MHYDPVTGLFVTDATDALIAQVPVSMLDESVNESASTLTQFNSPYSVSATPAVAATQSETVTAAPANPAAGAVSYSIYSTGILTLWEYAGGIWMPLYTFPPLPDSAAATPSASGTTTTPTAPVTTITLSQGYDNTGNITVTPFSSYLLYDISQQGTITNTGTLEALGAGSSLTLVGPGKPGHENATLDNSGGSVIANGGSVSIGPNMNGGTIVAENGGIISLAGFVSADTVQITNATLEFKGGVGDPGPDASMTNSVTLSGDWDVITYAPSALLDMSISFDKATNDLTMSWDHISAGNSRSFSLHLAGNYNASDFTPSGGSVIYIPHST